MRTHPIDPSVSTFYVAPMVKNAWEPMMEFVTSLFSLHKMHVFKWDENNFMCFL
jgi:hypothetical protein